MKVCRGCLTDRLKQNAKIGSITGEKRANICHSIVQSEAHYILKNDLTTVSH